MSDSNGAILVKMVIGGVSIGGLLLTLTGGMFNGFHNNGVDHKSMRDEISVGDEKNREKISELKDVVYEIHADVKVQHSILERIEKKL